MYLHGNAMAQLLFCCSCSVLIEGYIGGAYTNPAYGGHVELLLDQVKRSQSTGSELAVAMVEYTLAPMGQYPAQLRQAAVALNYILKTINVAPSNVRVDGNLSYLLFHCTPSH